MTDDTRGLNYSYAYIPNLDHTLYSLLAAGNSGTGAVSPFLVNHDPIPDIGYCGGWGVCFIERDYYVAGQIVAKTLSRKEWLYILQASLILQSGSIKGFRLICI